MNDFNRFAGKAADIGLWVVMVVIVMAPIGFVVWQVSQIAAMLVFGIGVALIMIILARVGWYRIQELRAAVAILQAAYPNLRRIPSWLMTLAVLLLFLVLMAGIIGALAVATPPGHTAR